MLRDDAHDGVVRLPCSLAMISTRSCCQTPTQLYVVPVARSKMMRRRTSNDGAM